MAITKTSICNMALGHIGVSQQLTDVDTDNSAESTACLVFYDNVLDEVLRAYAWPWATKTAALAQVATNPTAEWAFSYRFPSDAVLFRRVLQTARVDAADTIIPFRISLDGTGRLIYTSVASAVGEYTKRETDESIYPADFANLVSLLLATRVGPMLTKGGVAVKLADRAFTMYAQELQVAIAAAREEERRRAEEIVVATSPKENICNAALMHLGIDYELTNLTSEKTRYGRVMRQFYDEVRDIVLRDFDWPFARKVDVLALVASDPTDEWAFSYRYPSDCLKVRRILSGSRQDTPESAVAYNLANDGTGFLIYTDAVEAQIEYTVRLDNPTLYYMADFRGAFELALAARTSSALLPESRDKLLKQQTLRNLYAMSLAQARANALNEERPDPEQDSEFVRSR